MPRLPLPYDANLQMFIETDRTVDTNQLLFLRWLADHDMLEHEAAGQPAGNFVDLVYPTSDEAAAIA
jgi:hypothetical protein